MSSPVDGAGTALGATRSSDLIRSVSLAMPAPPLAEDDRLTEVDLAVTVGRAPTALTRHPYGSA